MCAFNFEKKFFNVAQLLCNGKKSKEISKMGFDNEWLKSKSNLAEKCFELSLNEDGEGDMRSTIDSLVTRLFNEDSVNEKLYQFVLDAERRLEARKRIAECLVARYVKQTYLW